jgi:tetratricopeptide (TPR) repeat protein
MIKAATSYLVLILLCGSQLQLAAQTSPNIIAGEEAARRQADTIQLRKTLVDASALKKSGDLPAAARKYEEALALVQRVGVGIDRERGETIAGFVAVRLELAQQAQKRGDLNEADAQITRALRVDPKNPAAEKFKLDNDRRIAGQRGRVPSREELARIPEVRGERVKTSTLVQDARLLMEMGKLDEAEAKLKQATKEDPENQGAFYYLKLLTERRFQQEARKREISSGEAILTVERSWNTPLTRDSLPSANPFATTNRVYTSAGRQMIYQKMDHIVLDEFSLPSEVPLSEVIKELSNEVKKRDPDKRGINFIISSQADKPAPLQLASQVDPLTGQPIAAQASDVPVVLDDFLVKMDPPLRNIRLEDLLKAIVLVAKPPANQSQTVSIKYSVEDYAVVFTQQGAAPSQPLYSRTFKVDPNTFRQGLEGVSYSPSPFLGLVTSQGGQPGGGAGGGGGLGGGQNGQTTGGGPGGFFTFGGNSQTTGGAGGGGGANGGLGGTGITGVTQTNEMFNIQQEVRNFFIAAGVDFATNALGQQAGGFGLNGQTPGQTPEQKTLFFNDRTGVLLVRATLRDLDIIEEAVRALNIAPPQVTIEAKFAEISQTDNKSLGFDWLLGNALFAGGAAGMQGGSAPSFAGAATAANPAGVFPGEFGSPSVPINAATDQLLTSNLRNSGAAPVATISGILTDPQFRLVIRALEQRGGVDLLSAPKITTLSGRQARISVEDTLTIIVGLGVQGLGGNGVGVPGVGAPAAAGISR